MFMQVDQVAVLRLKAVTEADPGALVRVLQLFQMRNVVPRRVSAARVGALYQEIEMEVDRAHLGPDVFRLIVARLNELPVVLAAVACDD